MLGSISKIRPCAHSHYYKYAHAVLQSDLNHLTTDYPNDMKEEGLWEFSLNNYTKRGIWADTASWVSDSVGLFKGNKKLKKIHTTFPNCINFNSTFQSCSYLEEIIIDEVDNDNIERCAYVFAWCPRLRKLPENFTPGKNLKESWGILREGATGLIYHNNMTLPYYEWIDNLSNADTQTISYRDGAEIPQKEMLLSMDERYTFSKIKRFWMGDASWTNGSRYMMRKLPDDISFENATEISLEGALYDEFHAALTLPYCNMITLDGNAQLKDLYRGHDSFSWPAMKNVQCGGRNSPASTMYDCALSGESVIKMINALPTWTDGKDKNTFSLMMHNDNYYNPEVNLAIKKLDKDYITPIEKAGGTLPEEVTEDKGWTVKCFICKNAWGRISEIDEYLNPEQINEIDFDNPILPNGYTRCKWLRSTMNEKQIIDTGYLPSDISGFYLISKPQFNNASSSAIPNNGYNSNQRAAMGNNVWNVDLPHNTGSNRWRATWGSSPALIDADHWYAGRTFLSKLNWLNDRKWSLEIPELSKSGTISKTLPAQTKSIHLFGYGEQSSTAEGKYFVGYLYRAKISENDQIIRDFIPCLNPNGKPCVYDVINGVEYHNQGTGADFQYEVYES